MDEIFEKIPNNVAEYLKKQNILELRPSQRKSIEAGLFENSNNQLVCCPTASGKTLVAELAMLDTILNKNKRVIYIVPLKALASEKYKEFRKLYGEDFKVRVSVGDVQNEKYSYDFDLLLVTSEKLDSLIRHDLNFINNVGLVIVDEIHLLNDDTRGPTLEILLSIFLTRFEDLRVIGLSATIGNSKALSQWLQADLILDSWRPVELEYHVLQDDNLIRYK